MSTTYTEHYNFGKQENYADLFSMKVITDNWDSLDAILYGFSTGKQDKLSATNKLSVAFVDFTPAQIAALGSGITDDDVEQISLNTQYGVKNLSAWTGGTAASDSSFVTSNQPISLSAGTYIVSYVTTATTGRAEVLFRSGSSSVGSITLDNSSGRISGTVTLSAAADNFNMFTMRACTVSEFMVSPFPDTTYQPYALSNAELTSRIMLYSDYEQIAMNTNLNNLTTIGKRYQCNAASIAATLTNCPTTDAFMMMNIETASVLRFVQEIISNKDNEIYRRWYTSTGFGSWYKFTGTQVQ